MSPMGVKEASASTGNKMKLFRITKDVIEASVSLGCVKEASKSSRDMKRSFHVTSSVKEAFVSPRSKI